MNIIEFFRVRYMFSALRFSPNSKVSNAAKTYNDCDDKSDIHVQYQKNETNLSERESQIENLYKRREEARLKEKQ